MNVQSPPVPARSMELRTLLLLGLAFGFAYFDRMAMSFLSPFVVKDLSLSNTQVGALGSGLSITWALGAYFVGRWSDSIGRRKPFLLAAMVVFSFCSVLSGLATGFGTLFATRVVMGAAEGPFLPICLAIMAAASAPQRRGLNAGVVQNVFGSVLGTALAPIVLIFIAERWGWRTSFYIAGVPGLILALLIWRYIAEPARPAAAGTQAEKQGLSPWAMLAKRNILLCSLISCCMVGTLVVGAIFMPLFFTTVRQYSPSTMGTIMAILGICPAFGGVLVAALSDRIGRRPPMIFFCFLTMICPLVALYFTGSTVVMTTLMVVSWIGIGVFPLFMGVIPAETLSFRNAATAMGLVVAIGELTGGVFAPLVGGWFADHGGLRNPLMLQVGLSIVAGFLSMALRETNPRFVKEPPTG